EILKAAQTAKKIGAKVSFDPNIRKELIGEKETDKILENLMRLTNVFLPGEEELLLLTGKETVEEAVEECFKNPEL
ncbi:PfkB family carbohydrate kinase, partial [Anaerofustis stercorihominis]